MTGCTRGALRRWAPTLLIALAAATAAGADATLAETGRRIYEDGVLPDGSALRALRPEGFVMEGRYAACATCHRRSGLGSIEGTVLVPPVAGPVLFRPARYHGFEFDPTHHYLPNPGWQRAMTRPAYDVASLERSLRELVDPGGAILRSPMPRYELDTHAAAALTAHMARLSAETPPGVEAGALHLATVLTPDVAPAVREAVAEVLQAWSAGATIAGRRWTLHRWTLTGAEDTWAAQLDAHLRRRPVFAVLSGAGGGRWAPVHRFCERHRLPCILPSVEVAPEIGKDRFSLYFSPGVTLEARILARFLRGAGPAAPAANQVASGPVSRHAASMLRAVTGDTAATARRFRLMAPAAALRGLSPSAQLVLWLRADEVSALAAAVPEPPAPVVYLSALLAPPEAVSLPASWRERVRFVSLFDDLSVQGEVARLRLKRWLARMGLPADPRTMRIRADAYAACSLLDTALEEMRKGEERWGTLPWSREHLLETLEAVVSKYDDATGFVDVDGHVAFYGRMSLGADRRVAAGGGTIVRYAGPASTRMVAVSERLVP